LPDLLPNHLEGRPCGKGTAGGETITTSDHVAEGAQEVLVTYFSLMVVSIRDGTWFSGTALLRK
jgi:hypothetical protein